MISPLTPRQSEFPIAPPLLGRSDRKHGTIPPRGRTSQAHTDTLQFSGWGKKAANGASKPAYWEVGWEKYERWQKKQLYRLGSAFEKSVNEIKRVCSRLILAIAAIISVVVPLPNSVKEALHRRYFFSPHKVSSSLLLKSPELRQKLIKLGFHPDKDSPHELSAWFMKAEKDKPTVVFSHGRDCNISHLEHVIKALHKKGFGVFVYDYPGFGRSEGRPTEQALYEAGLAASKFLTQKEGILNIPFEQQIIMGHSLGGAIAVDVAKKLSESNIQPKALVLVNTFTDIKTTFADQQKRYWSPIQKVFKIDKIPFSFNSQEKIKSVKMPVLVFHADQDKIINQRHGMALRNTFRQAQEAAKSGPKFKHDFIPLKASGHRLTEQSCETIVSKLDDFLQEAGAKAITHLA